MNFLLHASLKSGNILLEKQKPSYEGFCFCVIILAELQYKEKIVSNVNDGDQGQNNGIEDLPSNEVLLARAAETREVFYQDVRSMIESIPEKPNGKSLLSLEMMREGCRRRGLIPKF